MDANVELGEMEPERSRSRAEIGQAAVCDPRASMRAEQLVESVEIGEQRRPVVIFVLTETPEDVDERRAKRLIIAPALWHFADHRRRHAPRCTERGQLGSVQLTRARLGRTR